MKILFVSISLLGIILFANCTKSTAPITHDAIDSFLVKNFNYKLGTYWVYKDSLSGQYDSFAVVDNRFVSSKVSNSSFLDNIKIDINQYDHYRSKQAVWSMTLTGKAMNMSYNGKIQITYIFFILVPFKVGLLGYNDKDSGYVASVNLPYRIKSVVYNDVATIRHVNDYDPVFSHFDNTFYLNKDVGFIKMELKQDTHNILELERYHLVR
jgi:hypothetical protein